MFILGLTIFSDFPLFPFLSLSLPFLSPLFPSPSAPPPSLSLSLSSLSLPSLSFPLSPSPLPLSLKAVYALEFTGNRPSKLCCIGMYGKFWHQILLPILFLLHLDFASWLPSFPCLMVNHVVIVNHTPMARYFLVIQNSRVLFSHTFERFFPFSFSSLLLFFRPPPVESNFHTPLSLIFV